MNDTPETLVRETLEVEPTATERGAVWQSIIERLEAAEAPPARRPVRRLAAVAVAAAVAAAVLLLAADERGAPVLATASAAEVLNATAVSARTALPAVGPGEYLFTRASHTVTGAGAITVDIRSWTATDGTALIVDRDGRARSTTRYRAGSAVGVVTEKGRKTRTPPPQLAPNWRYVVPGDQIARLPAEPSALLALLRARAERATRLYSQPRPEGYFPRVDRTYELAGPDMLVVETTTALLVEAPLSPGQRAAMLSLLAAAPEWYRPGASAQPIRIRNLGATQDALGRDGIALRFTLELTSDETRGASSGTFDLVLDPEAGRLLETRSYEHGADADPVLLTIEEQQVVDSIDG
jgi:hypothetical protein